MSNQNTYDEDLQEGFEESMFPKQETGTQETEVKQSKVEQAEAEQPEIEQAEIEQAEELEEPIVEELESDVQSPGNWYTFQCFSQQEHKVQKRIQQMMENELKDKVFRVLLPEEETVEIKNNKRQERISKIYPGYIFINMLAEEEVWFLLRHIPGIAKVIGSGSMPTPVLSNEMDKILRQIGDKTKKIEVDFELEEVIKVIAGPFRGYSGVISEINPERGKLKSLISIFGRETPVELDFEQVEKTVGS